MAEQVLFVRTTSPSQAGAQIVFPVSPFPFGGQAYTRWVGFLYQLDNRVASVPGHCLGTVQRCFDCVEQIAVPMVLQHAPDTLMGLYLLR
jgi:hypothetical protein